MNKNLTKLITSAAVALAMGSSVQAQSQNKACPPAPFEQGYGITNDKFPAAYNAPARIDVQQSWDFFFTGSYTYWYVDETGFDLMIDTSSSPEEVLYQNNSFSSGFKAGIGMDFGYDSWVGFAEYTWLRNSSTFSTGLTSPDTTNLIDGDSDGPYGAKRRINLDMIDATLSRPFYEGRKLVVLPYSGIRAAWLRQNFRVTSSATDTYTHSNANSWLIGPRAGVSAHWMIGWGFRLEGDMGGALVFQQYKANFRPGTDVYKVGKQNRLAPIADAGLGLGWGTYLDRQNYHLDFVATYDFMNWWGQNFIRSTADSEASFIGAEPGSLQISGLTITARFDF